jgi:prevent-host-death family protein
MSDTVTATEAKNDFGRILERVIRGGQVVITKHDTPKAVLISVERYDLLSSGRQAKLDALTREYDALLDSMQTPKARAAVKKLFRASPRRLGQAAVAAARKHGR